MNKKANQFDDPRPNSDVNFYGDDSGPFGKTVAGDTEKVWAELKRLGLGENAGELSVRGITVIPPEKVARPGFHVELRDKILDIAERRNGVRYDLEKTESHGENAPLGTVLLYLLYEDPIFQEAILNPAALAITDYLVGKYAVLSTCDALIKGPGSGDLTLHADHFMMPAPFTIVNNQCNVTFALTDYTEENGALCVVPGSHHYRRQPVPGEGMDQRVVVNAKAGSLIIWDGNLWHGALSRTAPGVRVALSCTMMRPHMRPAENYTANATDEVLQRHPPRFATLVGKHVKIGWKDYHGPRGGYVGFDIARHAYE